RSRTVDSGVSSTTSAIVSRLGIVGSFLDERVGRPGARERQGVPPPRGRTRFAPNEAFEGYRSGPRDQERRIEEQRPSRDRQLARTSPSRQTSARGEPLVERRHGLARPCRELLRRIAPRLLAREIGGAAG